MFDIPETVVGLRLARRRKDGMWFISEALRFEGGSAAVETLLRRAHLSGHVSVGVSGRSNRHVACLLDDRLVVVETAVLDAKSYRSLKTKWAKCKIESVGELGLMEDHMDEHDAKALEMVAAERRRQVEVERWTADHDAAHQDGSLAIVSAMYALNTVPLQAGQIHLVAAARHYLWPRSWARWWWKPTTPLRDLEKAGALILAEIARRLREGEKP